MARHYREIHHDAVRIHVPDTTQQTDYSCGASCLQAVCKYYGVGPDDEWEYVEALRMDTRVGSHPDQIQRVANDHDLRFKEYWPMSISQLRAELRKRHPVLLMIQAYGEREGGLPRLDYRSDWMDGHWVVAIGYDRDAIFFEDPSLQAVRGYLLDDELAERWHDTARHGRHMEHYGLALWHPRVRRSSYASKAQRIP